MRPNTRDNEEKASTTACLHIHEHPVAKSSGDGHACLKNGIDIKGGEGQEEVFYPLRNGCLSVGKSKTSKTKYY